VYKLKVSSRLEPSLSDHDFYWYRTEVTSVLNFEISYIDSAQTHTIWALIRMNKFAHYDLV